MTEYYGTPPADAKNMPEIEWQTKLCEMGKNEWDKGQQHCSALNKLHEDIYSMLRGERPDKEYDWQSNIVINKVFQVVWTAVPYFLRKIFGATPVIGVEGFDRKGCWQREILLDKWRGKDNFGITLTMAVLRGVLNGVAFVKKDWKQKTIKLKQNKQAYAPRYDESGNMVQNQQAKMPVRTFPVEDGPDDTVLNNRDVVIDWALRPGQSCREGRFFIQREVVDLETLHASGVDYFNLDKIIEQTPVETTMNQDHASMLKKDRMENPPEQEFYKEVEVFERQGVLAVKREGDEWVPVLNLDEAYKEDSDVQFKHWIFTWANNDNPVLIRFEENTYGEINVNDLHFYFDPERQQGMGMVEPFKDVASAMMDNINAMFDEINKNLMPPTIFNKFAVFDWDSIQHAPGQKWLMQGNPNESVMMPRPTDITRDAWQRHALFDSEIKLTSSVMPAVQGADQAETATQGVLNAQFSTGKLDFLLWMIEQTYLTPDAQMTIRFAQKFAHPMTFISLLGEAFKFDQFHEEYKFRPVASSVKLEQQKEVEIKEDMQLIQMLSSMQNPNTAKMINYFMANILRNRGVPQMAEMLDEKYFEPQSEEGKTAMVMNSIGAGTPSNEQGIPMSDVERGARGATDQPRGMMQ